jgi:hypothetical protein
MSAVPLSLCGPLSYLFNGAGFSGRQILSQFHNCLSTGRGAAECFTNSSCAACGSRALPTLNHRRNFQGIALGRRFHEERNHLRKRSRTAVEFVAAVIHCRDIVRS